MIDRKTALIAVGVTVGAAALVLFLKKPAAVDHVQNNDIAGGFATASTVYVPTESYNIAYNNYKGAVSYSTVDHTTTTTVQNDPSGNPPPVHLPPPPPPPPVITTTGGSTAGTFNGGFANPPTIQTGTTPTAPAPAHPAPPVHTAPQAPKEIGTLHYATPKGGWNPNSIVDYVKEHGGDSSFSGRSKLAAAEGIKGYTGTAAQNQSLLSKLKGIYGAK